MTALTVRNLPAATHRALKIRSAQHGRSMEAEIRAIIEAAVMPPDRVLIGSELAALGRRFGGIDLDIPPRTPPAGAASFE